MRILLNLLTDNNNMNEKRHNAAQVAHETEEKVATKSMETRYAAHENKLRDIQDNIEDMRKAYTASSVIEFYKLCKCGDIDGLTTHFRNPVKINDDIPINTEFAYFLGKYKNNNIKEWLLNFDPEFCPDNVDNDYMADEHTPTYALYTAFDYYQPEVVKWIFTNVIYLPVPRNRCNISLFFDICYERKYFDLMKMIVEEMPPCFSERMREQYNNIKLKMD
jgi:hypothetical protein